MPTPPLDWTFGPAPASDEPAPAPGAPRRPRASLATARRLSRRTWLLLGAVGVLAVAVTLALPLIESARARRAVEQVVAAQESARLAADWPTLADSFAKDPLGWGAIHLARLKRGWLPTPISLPGLRADGQPGRVIRFQLIRSQLARADVARGFVLADGTPVTFAMPQFYQFTQGVWQQVGPPDASGEPVQNFHGTRVDLQADADDADVAGIMAGQIDDVLTRACADWNCAANWRVAVAYDASDPASAASPAPFDSLLGSLAFQIILGRPSSNTALRVTLASRFTGGYAADAAASEAVRRAAGVQALIALAQQIAPAALQHGENTYLDALIAREAARVGVDSPGLLTLQIANPLFTPAELWSVPLLHPATAGALPEALVLVNHILNQSSPTDEAGLMLALNSANSVGTWLGALHLGRDDAQTQLEAGLHPAFPPAPPPGFTPDLALSCPSGPLLATLSGQSAPLLSGLLPDSNVDAWSPDGQQVALRVSGRLSVVDLASHTGQFLGLPSWQEGVPPVWGSNRVLVIPFADTTTPTLNNTGLAVYDTNTHLSQSALFNAISYLPSPDGVWGAIVGHPFGSELVLNILPSPGAPPAGSNFRVIVGPIFTISAGSSPAWSADSQQLLFAQRVAGDVNLVIYNLATRDLRLVGDIGPAAISPLAPPSVSYADLIGAWSPSPDHLAAAIVTNGSSGSGFMGWVSLIRLRGDTESMTERLPTPRDDLYPISLAYSADGAELAVTLSDDSGPQGVALYSGAGKLLRWLPGAQAGPWSPTGHTLAVIGVSGVSLLPEPAAAPQSIGPAGCYGLAWRP